MICSHCKTKSCRNGLSCGKESFNRDDIIAEYSGRNNVDTPIFVRQAAELVDNGRAGSLSRIEELIDFIKGMQYRRVGLAYCYGMEQQAAAVVDLLLKRGIATESVSCTVGALPQNQVNIASKISNVSCNPIGQAEELNNSEVQLVITMGLCVGHDILFNRKLQKDVTTLVVKDRVHQHCPMKGIEKAAAKE